MKVLVTGAAGKLGSLAVAALCRHGHDVRATDARYRADLAVPLEPRNLLDEHALYPLLEGRDALVHLANHPNRFAGPSPQRLLSENTSMNANAFGVALELGVKHIVFSSSIQVMVTSDGTGATPEGIPYLPLDSEAPPAPGLNPYALSKHLAEELLRVAARTLPELCATSLRYPMLVSDWFTRRLLADGGRARRDLLHLGEATAHLAFEDAAELIAAVLARPAPGYRQYFPAQTIDVTNLSIPQLVERFYPDIRRKLPLASMAALVDIGRLERELGWRPSERVRVELIED
jgi:nucleoside-diphosphate-sugar epimerase